MEYKMRDTDREKVLHQLADALKAKGVEAEPLESYKYQHLNPFDESEGKELMEAAIGSRSACFKLHDQDVDMIYLMGLEEDGEASDIHYVVSGIRANEELSAEGRVKKKGLFGLGGVTGFEWRRGTSAKRLNRGGRIAEILNQDLALQEALISRRRGDHINIDESPEENLVAIWPDQGHMEPQEIAEFLVLANMIAKHVRKEASW